MGVIAGARRSTVAEGSVFSSSTGVTIGLFDDFDVDNFRTLGEGVLATDHRQSSLDFFVSWISGLPQHPEDGDEDEKTGNEYNAETESSDGDSWVQSTVIVVPTDSGKFVLTVLSIESSRAIAFVAD